MKYRPKKEIWKLENSWLVEQKRIALSLWHYHRSSQWKPLYKYSRTGQWLLPLVFGGLTLISLYFLEGQTRDPITLIDPTKRLRLKNNLPRKNAESQAQAATASFDATSSSSTTVPLPPWPLSSSPGSSSHLSFLLRFRNWCDRFSFPLGFYVLVSLCRSLSFC